MSIAIGESSGGGGGGTEQRRGGMRALLLIFWRDPMRQTVESVHDRRHCRVQAELRAPVRDRDTPHVAPIRDAVRGIGGSVKHTVRVE